MEFDQSEFFGASGNRVGLDKIAYVYVPTACQNGSQGIVSFDPQFRWLYIIISLMYWSLSLAHCSTWLLDVQVYL